MQERSMWNRLVSMLLISTTLAGCWYLTAGEWHDDPDNLAKALYFSIPDDVTAERSYYWQSPHFFTEDRYSFKIKYHQGFIDALTEHHDLVPIDSLDKKRTIACPSWFLPDDISKYTIFKRRNAGEWENFRLYIHKHNRMVYMCDELL